eukprot:gene9354-1616_t
MGESRLQWVPALPTIGYYQYCVIAFLLVECTSTQHRSRAASTKHLPHACQHAPAENKHTPQQRSRQKFHVRRNGVHALFSAGQIGGWGRESRQALRHPSGCFYEATETLKQ